MKKLTIVAAGLVGVLWLSTCVVFVDESEIGYVTRLGAVFRDGSVRQPGLLLKLPWPIDRVRRFDRRLQIYEPVALERMTRDKKPLTVGSYICWRIDDVEKFFVTVGTTGDANRRLEEQLSDQLSAAIGKRELSQFVSVEPGDSEINAMMDGLTIALRERARAEFGIDVVDVRLRRFNHPAEVRPAIYDRIRSERNMDAVRYRSEGDSEAEKIRSRAELKRDEILAGAEATATEIRGRAEAEKTRILNEAHAKDPGFYDLLRTLQAYRKILDEKTTLVLSTDNAIFRYLTHKQPPGPGSSDATEGSEETNGGNADNKPASNPDTGKEADAKAAD